MNVKTIRYERTFSLPDYENIKISCEVDAIPHGQEAVALDRARRFVITGFIKQMQQEGKHDVLQHKGLSGQMAH